jgi:hypothetical protein
MHAFSTGMVVALGTQGISALSTSSLAAITTNGIAALVTDQIVALTTDQTAALTPFQVEALTPDQVGAMTVEQFQTLQLGTPLILDLNRNGIFSQSIQQGVQFDLLATGTPTATGWVESGDGLLVMDRNLDGRITNGQELFGSATPLAPTGTAADGFAALATLDANHDGKIDAQDPGFAQLQVWVDGNSDGQSATAELHSLASLGIVSLDLNAAPTLTKDNGNVVGLVSAYQTADGSTHALADVWLAVDHSSLQSNVTSLVDALASFGTAPPVAAAPAATVTPSTPQPVPVPAVTVLAPTSTTGLVAALQQFDANGRDLTQATVPAVATTVADVSKLVPINSGPLSLGKG